MSNDLNNAAVVIFCDGYSFSNIRFSSIDEAKDYMKKQFSSAYVPEKDVNNQSFCNGLTAKVYRDGEDIFLWEILTINTFMQEASVMGNTEGVEPDCDHCVYAGCCEYGLTHHPDEMCKTGMDAFKKLSKE